MPSNETRPPIPEDTKRLVRQRCGFGCVICGRPIYDYDHLVDWAQTRRHIADELTLLCPQHHREKTAGLLTRERVAAANADPHNLRTGISSPMHMDFSGSTCQLKIGPVIAESPHLSSGAAIHALVIDGLSLLYFRREDDNLLLNILVLGELNQRILAVVDGELTYSADDNEVWDVEWVGRNLILRHGAGKFLFDIEFEPPSKVIVRRGRFRCNGAEVYVTPDYALLTNNDCLFAKGTIRSDIAIAVGDCPEEIAIPIQIQCSRYLGDSEAAIAKAEKKWRGGS